LNIINIIHIQYMIHYWKYPLAVVVTIGGRSRAVAQVVQAGHILATFVAAEIVPEKEKFCRQKTKSKLRFDVKLLETHNYRMARLNASKM
jgi:hypothetical protein